MKRILILNGSFCEVPIILKAKEMGLFVISTGNSPELIGHQYSDQYINADYSDKELILDIVKKNDVDGILSCANDFGTLTASYVSEKMGWKGHDSYETAKIIHHKDKFKEFTRNNNIPAPISVAFSNIEEARRYLERNEKYPIIIKANDLTGGKGIKRADNKVEAVEALYNAFSKSRDKRIVIETYIIGEQQTFVAFLINKKVHVYVSCNCYSQRNPYLIQSETFPAKNIDKNAQQLISIVEKMADILALCDGIIALQYIIKNNEIFVIESMRRPFGNQFLTLADLNSGFDWEKSQIIAELNLEKQYPCIHAPIYPFCGHHGVMAQQNGIIKRYSVPEEINKHIFMHIKMLRLGDIITDCMTQRIEYLYYQYDSLAEMNKEVVTFNDKITIEIQS